MTKKIRPWVVEYKQSGEWVFVSRLESQLEAKIHLRDYNELYDKNLLSTEEKAMFGPKMDSRYRYEEEGSDGT
jgi:hypothetical protein